MEYGQGKTFGLAYWIFNHKRQFRIVQVVSLVFVCLVIWGNNARFALQYLTHRDNDRVVQQSFLDTDILFDSIGAPEPLQVLSVTAMAHDSTHVDAVAFVRNPNRQFASHAMQGKFFVNGVAQPPILFFINPDESMYIPQLSIPSADLTPDVSFVLTDVSWFRARGFMSEARWEVSDIFYGPLAFGDQETDLKRQVSFSVTNKSAYGFENARVTVILKVDDEIVAVANTLTDSFPSFAEKQYTFTWSQELLLNAIPEVQIDVDRSDPDQLLSSN